MITEEGPEPTAARQEERFERLVAAGSIRRAAKPRGPLPEPLPCTGSVSDLVAEQRR